MDEKSRTSRRALLISGVGAVVSLAGCSGGDEPTDTSEPSATPTDTSEPSATPTDTSEPSATPTDTSEPSATPTATPTEPDDPASPVVQHYEALDQNDFEAANAAIHSESEQKPLSNEVIDHARQMNYAIDSIETDTDGEYPVVTVTVTETNSDSGDTRTLNRRIQVRRDDGDWKMFKILE